MNRLLLAFQFLTIIPVMRTENVSGEDMGRSTAFFPVVGAAQGLIILLSSAVFMKIFPAGPANGLVLLIMVIINGGLHLDGLADTFDALASRKDSERKLEIMKDSAVGPFGVIAVVFALLLKFLSLNALFFNSSPVTYNLSLFLLLVFSRWAMVSAIFHGKSARQDGLGKMFIDHAGAKEFIGATFMTVSFLLIALFVSGLLTHYSLLVTRYLLILPALYIFCVIAVWFSNRNFGGMTGDTFGAVSEISEVLFLMSAVLWSQHYT